MASALQVVYERDHKVWERESLQVAQRRQEKRSLAPQVISRLLRMADDTSRRASNLQRLVDHRPLHWCSLGPTVPARPE